jgi:hypothetical protein
MVSVTLTLLFDWMLSFDMIEKRPLSAFGPIWLRNAIEHASATSLLQM